MINLSKRLGAIAALVPRTGGVADVGTDHGYIPVWLLQNDFQGFVAATDINAGPLERARLTAAQYGISDKISFYLCDGLELVDADSVSTVIIAGMGGETIASILQNAPWTHDKLLILQPMSKSERLREWLFENGYRVLTERLVQDGAVYEILTATGGVDAPYGDGEILTGRFPLVSADPLFPARLSLLIKKTQRAVAGQSAASGAEGKTRLDALKKVLSGLYDMQSRLE